MNTADFYKGFFAGVATAGLFGFILQQLRLERKKMAAPGRPQTVTLKTEQTPEQIVRSSQVATFCFLFWLLVLAVVVVALFKFLPR